MCGDLPVGVGWIGVAMCGDLPVGIGVGTGVG
jgi:hypothetical protein